MNISKLLEALIDTKRDHRVTNSELTSDKRMRANYKKRDKYNDSKDAGVYGYVTKPSGDPHMISKRNFDPIEDEDGYYLYIKYIVDNRLYDENPYVPRIYKFRTLEDEYGNFKYDVGMERLTPLRDVDNEVILALGRQIFGQHYLENVDQHELDRFYNSHMLANSLWHAFEHNINKIIDKNLKDLVKVIREIGSFSKTSMDIHSGNIMVRFSPYPQLVIVDPLS